jgi:hypothetical protein
MNTGTLISRHNPNYNLKLVKWKLPFWGWFFSDKFFLPKMDLVIINDGEDLQFTHVSVYAAKDSEFGEAESLSIRVPMIRDWKSKEERVIRAVFPPDRLTKGMYFIRFIAVEMFPEPVLSYAEQRAGIESLNLPKNERNKLLDKISELERQGMVLEPSYSGGGVALEMRLTRGMKVNSFFGESVFRVVVSLVSLIYTIVRLILFFIQGK